MAGRALLFVAREGAAALVAVGAAVAAAGVVDDGSASPMARGLIVGGLGALVAVIAVGVDRLARRSPMASTGRSARWLTGGIGDTPADALAHLERGMRQARVRGERPARLAGALVELLVGADAGLGDVRLYRLSAAGERLVVVDASARDDAGRNGGGLSLDRRVAAWLVANPQPIDARRVGEMPLGGLRQVIEAFVTALDADLILPLCHRQHLIGIATARGNARNALRAGRGARIAAAQEAAASALDELELREQASERAAVAREVEQAASVVRQGEARAVVERLAGCEVTRCHVPARRFGGAWWTTFELPGGRLFAAMGEVSSRGVAAALLSATAVGVCEAAGRLVGGTLDVAVILDRVHEAVHRTGNGAYTMSCFACVIDPRRGEIVFANAGHPFPYLCKTAEDGGLCSLVARGSQLGGRNSPAKTVARESTRPGDVLLFFTASVIDARSAGGQPFSDRRIQRILRGARPGVDRPAQIADRVLDDVKVHMGAAAAELQDDLLITTIQIG